MIGPRLDIPKMLPRPPSKIKSPPPIPSLDLIILKRAFINHKDTNPATSPSNASWYEVKILKTILIKSPIKIKLTFK